MKASPSIAIATHAATNATPTLPLAAATTARPQNALAITTYRSRPRVVERQVAMRRRMRKNMRLTLTLLITNRGRVEEVSREGLERHEFVLVRNVSLHKMDFAHINRAFYCLSHRQVAVCGEEDSR